MVGFNPTRSAFYDSQQMRLTSLANTAKLTDDNLQPLTADNKTGSKLTKPNRQELTPLNFDGDDSELDEESDNLTPLYAAETSTSPIARGNSSSGEKVAMRLNDFVGFPNWDSPPECKEGKLACAWFVSRVLEKTLGFTNGSLSVKQLITNLEKAGAVQISASEAKPGDICAVDGGKQYQHTGIVGKDGDTLVHNSGQAGESIETASLTFPHYQEAGDKYTYWRLPDTIEKA
jgi:hypothetical protein